MQQKIAVVLKYSGLLLLCAVLLIGIYLVVAIIEGRPAGLKFVQTASRFYASAPTCAFSDKSFCGTEQTFRKLVAEADSSDLLEQQAYSTVTCSTTAQQSACATAKSGLTIQLFRVIYNGSTSQLTRNDYIAYFRTYFTTKGPLVFERDTTVAQGVEMLFRNPHQSSTLRLQFQKDRGVWKFVVPVITTP